MGFASLYTRTGNRPLILSTCPTCDPVTPRLLNCSAQRKLQTPTAATLQRLRLRRMDENGRTA
jgi:hypothetical protein